MTNDQQTARCRDQMGQVQGAQDHRSVSILDIEFRSSALARMAPIKRPTLDGKTAPRNTWLAPSRPEPPISHPFMQRIGDEPEQHRRPSRLVRRCHRRMRESEPSQPNVSRQSFPEGSEPSIRTHPSWDSFGGVASNLTVRITTTADSCLVSGGLLHEAMAATVGVLALQGGFLEHLSLLQKSAQHLTSTSSHKSRPSFDFIEVRNPHDLARCDALIIPGGESTTIALIAAQSGLMEPLRDFVK